MMMGQNMTISADFVSLELDGTLYGIPVERVQEILDMRPVSPVPNAPAHLLGVIDLRGQNVPVVDMRNLLGLPPKGDTPKTRILVALLRQGGQNAVIGLRTDTVIDVTRLDDDDLQPLRQGQLLAWDAASILGIGRRGGAVISIIDLDGLFTPVPVGQEIAGRHRFSEVAA
jgi:purine-binding chemotaxis protein CheW